MGMVERACGNCGTPMLVQEDRIARGRGRYCSKACKRDAQRTKDPVATFWSYVDKSGHPDGCWIWTGGKDPDGYGVAYDGKKQQRAHRYAFFVTYGFLPEYRFEDAAGSLVVCHTCDNPSCVNPDHLFLGTTRDNIRDALSKGRIDRRGARGPGHKITEREAMAIRELYASGVRQGTIGKMFGLKQATISNIIVGKTWVHLPLIPRRVKRQQINQRGEKSHNAKVSNADARKMREMRAAGMKNVEIARAFGVNPGLVQRIVSGKRYVNV